MKVTHCDRCGVQCSPDSVAPENKGWLIWKEIELCPECKDAFYTWLDKR